MADFDVAIIGGGPAGLTAGLYLARSRRRTIILEKESFGGNVKNIELVENYPGFAQGVSGAHLSAEMVSQATKSGVQLETTEVTGLELYSSSIWVQCTLGKGYTVRAIIVAGGSRYKKLGIPGEEELRGKGVINCALCEGGQFTNKVVAVCGGGNTGVTEALYLANMASKVFLIEAMPALTATAVLQERVASNPKLEVHCGTRVRAIAGNRQVETVELQKTQPGEQGTLKIDGIVIAVGLEPNTRYLEGIVPLDEIGQIMVNSRMETEVPGIFAAGDVRHDSPRQIASAVGDGTIAAISADKYLG